MSISINSMPHVLVLIKIQCTCSYYTNMHNYDIVEVMHYAWWEKSYSDHNYYETLNNHILNNMKLESALYSCKFNNTYSIL